MFYYKAWIEGFIFLALWLFLLWAERKRRFRYKSLLHGLIGAGMFFLCIHTWNERGAENLLHHMEIMGASRLTLTREEHTEAFALDFDRAGPFWLQHMEEAPRYVREEDFQPLAEGEFQDETGRTIAKVRIGRLLHPEQYPSEGITAVGGSPYCLLSTRFLYRGALYYFLEEFSSYIIDLVQRKE